MGLLGSTTFFGPCCSLCPWPDSEDRRAWRGFPIVKRVRHRRLVPVLKRRSSRPLPSRSWRSRRVWRMAFGRGAADSRPVLCTVPLLLYGVMGTSGQVALGPVAMISLLTSGAISALPGVTPGITVALVHLLALLYGVSSLLLGLLGLGSVTQFLSHEVLGGYCCRRRHHIVQPNEIRAGVSVGRHHYPAETIVEVLSKFRRQTCGALQ